MKNHLLVNDSDNRDRGKGRASFSILTVPIHVLGEQLHSYRIQAMGSSFLKEPRFLGAKCFELGVLVPKH